MEVLYIVPASSLLGLGDLHTLGQADKQSSGGVFEYSLYILMEVGAHVFGGGGGAVTPRHPLGPALFGSCLLEKIVP
jgi:hypothetical protein